MNENNDFGKTICSICYEDLKPLVEDLQAISICGHVFHELCLQQWLEYCNGKKSTCPVCKQRCCQENINRLYFQSVGDPTDLILSHKPLIGSKEQEEDPSVLRKEVKKLENKLSGLNIAFERQQKELKELNEELDVCKENSKKESILKIEALQLKVLIQQKLQSKTEELVRTLSECSRLQERNLALAKELAALKLVSDLNLEEEEVVKLASFGNGNNNKDTIDVLKKSLVLRNKSYKELMAQCNLLGRGETRSLKKLEKAKEKMKKLKTRVQELEMVLEEKDNEVLRVLKASKETSCKKVDLNGVKSVSNTPLLNKCSTEDQMTNENQGGGLINPPSQFRKTLSFDFNKDSGASTCKKNIDIIDTDPGKDFSFVANENASELQSAVHEHSSPLNPRTSATCSENVTLMKSFSRPTTVSDTNTPASMPGQTMSFGLPSTDSRKDISNTFVCDMEEDVIEVSAPSSVVETVILDDMKEEPPLLHIRKESAFHVSTSRLGAGDQCFVGGLVGPDGGSRYLGKWCKRTQADTLTSSPTVQGSNTSMGDLIASGADGRGGRIKVLRTDKPSDNMVSTSLQKKCKYGAKQKGCLQIEHFFGKANRS